MSLPDHLRRSRFERGFVFIAVMFAVLMVLTNVIGTKLFLLFPELLPTGFGGLTGYGFVVLTTGLVTYPLTFLFTDVASEVWGKKRANYMVLLGFLASVLMLLVVWISVQVPRADRFWADATGQAREGTVVLQDAGKGSNEVYVDDAMHLLLDPEKAGGKSLYVGVISQGSDDIRFVKYNGFRRPEVTVPGEGGETTQNSRWDHRGWLQLPEQLTQTIAKGSVIIPAVSIAAGFNDGNLTVDRPVPVRGQLVTASGTTLSYNDAADNGQLELGDVGDAAATLTAGKQLGVFNTFSTSQMQQNFEATFAAPGILLFSSMLAYLVAQFLDVWLYHFWKRVTGGRFMWLRNNGSTMISQLVDTIIVNSIFLTVAFNMPAGAVVNVIICVYIVKMVLAWIDTPLIYLGVYLSKRWLGYRFDEDVDYDLLKTLEDYPQGNLPADGRPHPPTP